VDSHTYYGITLPLKKYKEIRKDMKEEDQKICYQLFEEYENWKYNLGGYDFMDVVNYVLKRVIYGWCSPIDINYLMVDEV
jgi:hypothetical protein